MFIAKKSTIKKIRKNPQQRQAIILTTKLGKLVELIN